MPAAVLREGVKDMSELQTGAVLTGTVQNVVPFGAFVDIGPRSINSKQLRAASEAPDPIVKCTKSVKALKVSQQRISLVRQHSY
eukprot:6886034-Pyramimonas_sp.AAC.1